MTTLFRVFKAEGAMDGCDRMRTYRHVTYSLWVQDYRSHRGVWGFSMRLGRSRRLRPYGFKTKTAADVAARARIDRYWAEKHEGE